MAQTDLLLMNLGNTDINPLVCGWESCASGHRYGPAAREYYLIHFVVSGRGIFRQNGTTHTVEANSAFLIFPDEIIYYESDLADPWTYIWIGFNGSLAGKLIAQAGLTPENCILLDAMAGQIFREIRTESNQQTELELYLTGKIFELFSIMIKHPGKNSAQYGYVKKTMDYIDSNYDRDITVDGIARLAGVDRRYLCRLFQKETGQSTRDYLMQVRMIKAIYYLKEQLYSVQDAARSVGYYDPITFSKAFKKYFGVSPRRYRKID